MSIELKILIDRYVGFFCIFWLNILARIIGVSIHRDHSLQVRGDILVIKMLGGGSLVVALPALLGIKRAFPNSRVRLFTTASVKPFAETLGVFDEILALDDSSIGRLFTSGLNCLRSSFGSDVVIDLEVYSYLTTVFSLATFARNRLGFYFDEKGFAQRLHTHRVFFNLAAPLYRHYDRMALLLGANIATMSECADHLLSILKLDRHAKRETKQKIAIGAGCSAFSGEVRKLSPQQWSQHVFAAEPNKDATVLFLGSLEDFTTVEEIIDAIRNDNALGWTGELINRCGTMNLSESLRELMECDAFWGIDSSLLHYARLFGIPTEGYFGPADPATRLRPIADLKERIYYRRTLCSPCVHQVSQAPCHGNNVCMQWLFDDVRADDPRAAWIPAVVDTAYTEKERL